MSPLDGLKRVKKRKRDKIYRASSRINFLTDQKINPAPSCRNCLQDKDPAGRCGIKELSDKQLGKPAQPPVKISRFERPQIKKYAFLKIIMTCLVIILISAAMYFSERLFTPNDSVMASLNKFNPFSRLAHLVTSGDKRVAGEFDDRVNILALGIGGPGHDGPYLTDTIMVLSIKPSTGEVGIVSIPRDMLVKLRDDKWYKVNQIYSIGKVNNPKKASDYIVQAIEDTLDIKIHYWGVVSFWGFEHFIDEIGGISVDVPRGFTDPSFPTADFKTTTVSFAPGLQTMDGKTALIYARSRYGDNFEGSDFARSKRQQLILQAVKDKLFKFSTLLSPQKLSAIFDLMGNSVETNVSIWQAIKIVQMAKDTDENKIYRIVLDDMPDSILEPGFTEEGAWILKPKDGNFDTLARQFNNIFNTGDINEEDAKIAIQNGTETNGLAYWTSVHLEKLGYNIFNYGNANSQDYQRTVIYDLSDGQKKKTLKYLKEELDAYVAKPVPDYLLEKYPPINQTSTSTLDVIDERPDLVAVLGFDHADRFKLPELGETATSTDEVATSTDEIIEE